MASATPITDIVLQLSGSSGSSSGGPKPRLCWTNGSPQVVSPQRVIVFRDPALKEKKTTGRVIPLSSGIVSVDWLTQLSRRLDSFLHLKEGWNGYKAIPPSQKAVSAAKFFLHLMKQDNFCPSRLAPSAVGGVGITRRSGGRKVYVEFYNDGRIHALLSDGSSDLQTQPVQPTTQDFRKFLATMRAYLNE
jgi:hypothetical protein